MRKFYLRWWYTPRWQGDRLMQAIREWNQKQLAGIEVFDDKYDCGMCEINDTVDVAVHRLIHKLPYTGSGDLFDPYRT